MPVVVEVPLLAPAAVADGVGQGEDPLRGWVYVLVFASLIGQAIVLLSHGICADDRRLVDVPVWGQQTRRGSGGGLSGRAAAGHRDAAGNRCRVGELVVAAGPGVAGDGWVSRLTVVVTKTVCIYQDTLYCSLVTSEWFLPAPATGEDAHD